MCKVIYEVFVEKGEYDRWVPHSFYTTDKKFAKAYVKKANQLIKKLKEFYLKPYLKQYIKTNYDHNVFKVADNPKIASRRFYKLHELYTFKYRESAIRNKF